jgi:hypothetical protein
MAIQMTLKILSAVYAELLHASRSSHRQLLDDVRAALEHMTMNAPACE